MPKSPDKGIVSIKSIEIKRERWKNGTYHVVARQSGRIVTHTPWHDKESTEFVEEKVSIIITERPPVAVRAAAPRPAPRHEEPEEPEVRKPSQRFDITLKIITDSDKKWFLVIESGKKYLNANEIRRIKERIQDKYVPQTSNPIYDEGIYDVIPVLCRDSHTGEKEEY